LLAATLALGRPGLGRDWSRLSGRRRLTVIGTSGRDVTMFGCLIASDMADSSIEFYKMRSKEARCAGYKMHPERGGKRVVISEQLPGSVQFLATYVF